MLPPSHTGLFFWSWKQALQSCRKPATFLPFAGYAAAQLFLLAGLFFFIYSPFSFTFMPLQGGLFGEATLHYPTNFVIMPQMFEILNIILSGIIGSLVIGRATVLFFNLGDTPGKKLETKLVNKRYFHLFGAWLGQTVLVLSVIWSFVWLAAKMPGAAIYFAVLRVLTAMLVSSIFTFTTAVIVVDQKPFWQALPQSAKIFAGYVLVTFLLVALPSLIQFPAQFLLANSVKIVRRLNPETIALVIAIGVVSSMVSNYFMIGTVTHLYRGLSRDAGIKK